MKSKDKVLLIDGDNLCHRAYHKFAQLTTKKGESTALPFGFFYILNSLIRRLAGDRVYIAFDGGSSKIRKEILPGYKDRDKKDTFDSETFYRQKKEIMEQCLNLNISTLWREGYEADDLIYMFIKRRFKGEYLTIVSSDKDFIHLLKGTITIFNPFKNKTLTEQNLEDEVGYNPREHLDYLILKGDKSDKIPGCSGMGEVRIREFLDEYGSIEKYLETRDPAKDRWSNYDIYRVYKTNNKLINLKLFYSRFLRKEPLPIIHGSLDIPAFSKWCREYEITKLKHDNFKDLI